MGDVLEKISELSRSHASEDFLRTLFGDRVGNAIDGSMPVIMFGAGDVGRDLCEALQLHGVYPICFCDNNPANTGKEFYGVPVISFSDLKQAYQNQLIIVATSKFADEIKQQLMDHAFPAENLILVSPIRHPELLRYYKHCPYYTNNPCHALSLQDLYNHKEELARAYDLMADQKSRDLFIARISLFISKIDFLRFSSYIADYSEINEEARDSFPFYVSPEDYGYFNNDVFSLDEGEVLVDGGAYNGLSAATFAETCKRNHLSYKKIYCFEPDAGNFQILKDFASRMPNITCINRGLWSRETTLTFISNGDCDPAAVLEVCSDTSAAKVCTHKTEIRTISIDEQFPEEEVTLIKMDIEGAEIEALNGAAKVIERCRPKLAISAYHKHSDIYTIPLLIHNLSSSYTFYLRQFGYTLFDMVLFAVPDKS